MSQLKKQHGKAEALTVGMMLDEYTKERCVLGKVLPLTSLSANINETPILGRNRVK